MPLIRKKENLDLVEYIRQLFFFKYKRYSRKTKSLDAKLNTETPYGPLTGLSILALKIYHTWSRRLTERNYQAWNIAKNALQN